MAVLGNQTQSPAAVTAPHDDLAVASDPADGVVAAPPEDLLAEVPSTPAATEVPAATAPAEASLADTETGAPVLPEESVLIDVEAEASVLAAGAASRDTESEAPSRAAAASWGNETLRTADLVSAGGHSRAPAARADRVRLAAGVLAIAAAILALAGLSVIYQTVSESSSFRLADYPWDRWYVILGAVVDLVAGACLVIPRTKRFIGPGILLGAVAVS